MNRVRDYVQLIKPSLTIMVVFSSVVSYLLAPKVVEYNWGMIVLLFAGGMLVTGSANAINQALEKETDAMMRRTAKRPVASGRMSENAAWTFAGITGGAGILVLGIFFNWIAAILAALSLFLYGFVYTPLKKINSISVLVGAVPGALPCLIGWAAGDDRLSIGGWILFAWQFLWQFPHFFAIAWVAHRDYTAAGFRLLPSESGPTQFTALQTVAYSLLLLPLSLAPFYAGICDYADTVGKVSLGIIVAANLFLIARCIRLYRRMDVPSARQVMFGSYIYLPVVFFSLLAAKA
ncbi:MAG TPA: heme o synthase [Chitinophagaceae bacterium]|nr:heme o synthase [Chitinophagaceae bacterium]